MHLPGWSALSIMQERRLRVEQAIALSATVRPYRTRTAKFLVVGASLRRGPCLPVEKVNLVSSTLRGFGGFVFRGLTDLGIELPCQASFMIVIEWGTTKSGIGIGVLERRSGPYDRTIIGA